MKVFLSWSGGRSKMVAEAFNRFLKQVIQATQPWISTAIMKGTPSDSEIKEGLKDAKVGIICLTSDNLTAPWLLYEAGAISNNPGTHVCTFLLDVANEDVEPPLGRFQHTSFNKQDVLLLVKTINSAVGISGGNAVELQSLEEIFDLTWSKFESALIDAKKTKPVTKPTKRGIDDLVSEVLETVRNIDRDVQNLNSYTRVGVGEFGVPRGGIPMNAVRRGGMVTQAVPSLVRELYGEDAATFSPMTQGLTRKPLVEPKEN